MREVERIICLEIDAPVVLDQAATEEGLGALTVVGEDVPADCPLHMLPEARQLGHFIACLDCPCGQVIKQEKIA